jgi:hypothetical protein
MNECIFTASEKIPITYFVYLLHTQNQTSHQKSFGPKASWILIQYPFMTCDYTLKGTIFWNITLCSPLKVYPRFGGTYRLLCLPPAFKLGTCSAYSTTLKMEVICSSKMLVDFQWTTPCYITEDRTLHNHCCENLKSYMIIPCLKV